MRNLSRFANEKPAEDGPELQAWRATFLSLPDRDKLAVCEYAIGKSTEDGLTGLLRRPAFRGRAVSILRRAAGEKGKPAGILIIDADHFKEVNDGPGGHAAGDEVLKRLANCAEVTARPTDFVCRWGGDEFVVLLPNTDCIHAVGVAERIRSRVAEELADVGVTVSVGVTCTGSTFDLDELIGKADKGLLRAKESGKNRVVVCTQ